MRTPIPERWFRRVLLDNNRTRGPNLFGFSVRFPGRTPDDARRWLRSHGYTFSGRGWQRADRAPSRLSYEDKATHATRVSARRRSRAAQLSSRQEVP